ncbi:hypothetical protein CRUP_025057, partial [Coryphaenoides rupestris]
MFFFLTNKTPPLFQTN